MKGDWLRQEISTLRISKPGGYKIRQQDKVKMATSHHPSPYMRDSIHLCVCHIFQDIKFVPPCVSPACFRRPLCTQVQGGKPCPQRQQPTCEVNGVSLMSPAGMHLGDASVSKHFSMICPWTGIRRLPKANTANKHVLNQYTQNSVDRLLPMLKDFQLHIGKVIAEVFAPFFNTACRLLWLAYSLPTLP